MRPLLEPSAETSSGAPPAGETQGQPGAAPPTGSALARLNALTRRRGERVLEAVATLGHPTGQEHNLGDYLERVAAAMCYALDYRVCVIYLYDSGDDTFYAEATRGVGEEERGELLATPVPTRVAGQLMAECFRLDWSYYIPASAPIWDDPEVAACFAMSAAVAAPWQPGWQPGDVFLVPLEIEGKDPIGFLVVDEPVDGRLPDPETLLGMVALAKSCANAVESAHLYKTQTEEAAISSALLQVSEAVGTPDQNLLFMRASSILAALLDAGHCAVWYDEDGTVALHLVVDALNWRDDSALPREMWAAEDGLRAALTRGEPLVLEQMSASDGVAGLAEHLGLTSALLIPLFLHDALVGAILVGWTGAPHRFRSRELDIARGVSRLVGVALQNARLYRDTTRQAERNARLYEREREAVRRLQELDQLRNDFVSTVSHELRTPLTGIKGFTDTLLTYWQRMDDGRRMEMVRRINASSCRLERLVHDLLFVSGIESGTLPVRRETTELHPLIEGAVQEVEGKYRGQEIQMRAATEPLFAVVDPHRLQQVLVNLLDNAVKYSPEGRPIRVRWRREGRMARISVVDMGPGIGPGDQARLFTRFGKLDRTPRPGHGGTGLGLYISKSLIETMGGRIEVHSRPGWGSIFTFTVLLAR